MQAFLAHICMFVYSVYEVDIPVRGLAVRLTSPLMITADSFVQFNISLVDGPTNISYSMDYGDNSGQTLFNDSSIYNHSFSMTGEFTLTATGNDVKQTVSEFQYFGISLVSQRQICF